MYDPNKPSVVMPTEREIERSTNGQAFIPCYKCRHKQVCRFIGQLDEICSRINGIYYNDPDIKPNPDGDKPMFPYLDNGLAVITIHCNFYDASKRDDR